MFNRNNNSKLAKEIMGKISESLSSSLGNRVAFSSCFNYGACVTETDPHSQAAIEVKNLIDEIFLLIE